MSEKGGITYFKENNKYYKSGKDYKTHYKNDNLYVRTSNPDHPFIKYDGKNNFKKTNDVPLNPYQRLVRNYYSRHHGNTKTLFKEVAYAYRSEQKKKNPSKIDRLFDAIHYHKTYSEGGLNLDQIRKIALEHEFDTSSIISRKEVETRLRNEFAF